MSNSQYFNIYIYNKNKLLIKTLKAKAGSNLWVCLKKNKIQIGSACAAAGVCAACSVTVHEIYDKALDTSKITELEIKTLKNNHKQKNERLACLFLVYSDVHISTNYC